ncbi:MAG TPA: MFS transporter [Xanthobacteraceae bacterium]|nr:MFS transporter [Xanthobacteraceae bacterium]
MRIFSREPIQPDVLRLALAQALGGANSAIIFATGAIVGEMFAPNKALATLPISLFVVGMALSTLPTGAVAQRHGRRTAFMIGTTLGVLTGLLASIAVLFGSFALFCVATFVGGVYAAVVQSFRFAAADCVAHERRARALSAVMAGGVFAGVIGPQVVNFTMNLWEPYLFAMTYLAQGAIALLSMLVLAGIKIPPPARSDREAGRPLAEIARQPRFIAAATCGVVSYMMMNLVMTSAPLAMKLCGLPLTASNTGLQWHVIAMYGPSFFTGRLITRFGAPVIVTIGLMLTAAAAGVGLSGTDIPHFWTALVLLGVGWNFGFVGASTLVLECHRPEERAKVQSFNDFIVFGSMVIGSFASGGLLTAYGWSAVCLVTLPPLAFAALTLAWARSQTLRVSA